MSVSPKSLRSWIGRLGVPKVAKLLNVEEATVRHWRRGHCLPKAEQMYQIQKLSKGQVTYDGIINEHFEKRGRP